MTTRTVTLAQQQKFIKRAEEQGCEVVRKKSGLFVKFPDGGTASLHFTSGDRKSMLAAAQHWRRHGLRFPFDTRDYLYGKDADMSVSNGGYPSYIVDGTVTKRTKTKALSELAEMGWPLRVKATQLSMESSVAGKALYQIGYRWDPASSPARRIWVAPKDIEQLHAQQNHQDAAFSATGEAEVVPATPLTVHDEQKRRLEAMAETVYEEPVEEQTTVSNEGETHVTFTADPEVVKALSEIVMNDEESTAEDREFIDEHDSWTADLDAIEDDMTIARYIELTNSLGLAMEIRVWRRGN